MRRDTLEPPPLPGAVLGAAIGTIVRADGDLAADSGHRGQGPPLFFNAARESRRGEIRKIRRYLFGPVGA